MSTSRVRGRQNPYGTLGVSRRASAEEIKRAYRKLAMELHPDRNGGSKAAEAAFKDLAEAYDILKDEARRASFDRFGSDDAWQRERSSRTDASDRREESGPHGRDRGSERSSDSKSRDRSKSHPRRERLHMAKSLGIKQFNTKTGVWTLKLSLIEAIFGGVLTVDLAGSTFVIQLDPNMTSGDIISCRIGDRRGPMLRFKVSVQKDPLFRRVKDDIVVKLPITLRQACLGGPVRIPTIYGPVIINLKPRLGGSGRFRIPGYGIDDGAQVVEYQVALAKTPEPELEAFLRGWSPRNPQN